MDDKNIQRIDGILKLIKIIQEDLDGVTFEDFSKSHLMVNSISFSIAQIGEKMVKLEELLSSKYPDMPWKDATKMRNIIVHEYENSNPSTVYETATTDLNNLKLFILKIKDDIKHISDNSINTERLIIRPWDDLDGDELYELAKNPEIGRWCGWEPHKTMRDTMFVLHNFLEIKETFAICSKSGKVIGSIGLIFGENTSLAKNENECELGYWIGKPYQEKGYASEAGAAMIKHAFFDLNIQKIWAKIFNNNKKSKRVLEKLNFEFCFNTTVENNTFCIYSLSKNHK